MTRPFRLWALLLVLAGPGSAAAEVQRPAAPDTLGGLVGEQNKDKPIQIESASLEVHDKTKVATFHGDVVVVQGDMTLKCQTLVVFYGPEEGKPAASASHAAAAPPGAHHESKMVGPGKQDIRRIEARGGVTVVSKDQNASGELGIYDLKANTITLTGNVVITQGKNVMHGDRVVFDTITGDARVESGATVQDRVRALILPNKGENGGSTNVISFGPNRPN
jgi:lipopolysaccharide export system protein LptA